MKLFLTITLCLGLCLRMQAQEAVELPIVSGELTPGVADKIFDPQQATIVRATGQLKKKTVVSELDLDLPENTMLDSLFNFYGEVSTLNQVICEAVAKKKVQAYEGTEENNASLEAIPGKQAGRIVDTLARANPRSIVLLKEWVYNEQTGHASFRNLAFSVATRNAAGELVPLFWVMYPEISPIFHKYKFVDKRGSKKRLTEFFESTGWSAIMMELSPPRFTMRKPANSSYKELPPADAFRIVIREIDLDLADNKVLDSIFTPGGKAVSFRELILECLFAHQMDAYRLVELPDSFVVVEHREATRIVGGMGDTVYNKVYLQERWMFYEEHGRMDVRIEMLAPGAQNDSSGYKSATWVAYPKIRKLFDGYYLYDSQGLKRSLVEYFDHRWYRSKMLYSAKTSSKLK